mmetsp:Transcript_34433/g.101203  ORF Transcript_34433/g.101203 Transcript_34433/m.101203 type:complete len:164 (-) Transcript_34433:353-844(-)
MPRRSTALSGRFISESAVMSSSRQHIANMSQTGMAGRAASQQRRQLIGHGDNDGSRSGRSSRRRRNQASPSSAAAGLNDASATAGGASTAQTPTVDDDNEGAGIVGTARRLLGQSLNFGASASGSSTATNEVKDILRELVEGGYLCDGTALPNTWLARLDGKE